MHASILKKILKKKKIMHAFEKNFMHSINEFSHKKISFKHTLYMHSKKFHAFTNSFSQKKRKIFQTYIIYVFPKKLMHS